MKVNKKQKKREMEMETGTETERWKVWMQIRTMQLRSDDSGMDPHFEASKVLQSFCLADVAVELKYLEDPEITDGHDCECGNCGVGGGSATTAMDGTRALLEMDARSGTHMVPCAFLREVGDRLAGHMAQNRHIWRWRRRLTHM